jgi:hypothetical protein
MTPLSRRTSLPVGGGYFVVLAGYTENADFCGRGLGCVGLSQLGQLPSVQATSLDSRYERDACS